jgi:putative acetyltransferase
MELQNEISQVHPADYPRVVEVWEASVRATHHFTAVGGDMVEMLFIHPNWRGKGIGKRLLHYAVEKFSAVRLDVNEQNEQAVGFYLHEGFEVAGRSERDGFGKPYPLLHLRLSNTKD